MTERNINSFPKAIFNLYYSTYKPILYERAIRKGCPFLLAEWRNLSHFIGYFAKNNRILILFQQFFHNLKGFLKIMQYNYNILIFSEGDFVWRV